MKVIPAIDIMEGQVVRLEKGLETMKKEYSIFVWELVEVYKKYNIKDIHLVNLSSALSDSRREGIQAETLEKLNDFNVQIGGGLRGIEDFAYYSNFGINRFVISTILYTDLQLCKELVLRSYELIAALDVKDQVVFIKGWKESTNETVYTAIERCLELGIHSFLITDINRDGMLDGFNVSLYEEIKKRYPQINLIASGGCSQLKDLENLKSVNCDAAVVGKALLDKRIDYNDITNGIL